MNESNLPRTDARGSAARTRHRLPAPLVYALICLLSACAATVDPITTPRGRTGFVVTCDSPQGWPACYRAEEEACEGRYRVIDRSERAKRLVTECDRHRRYE